MFSFKALADTVKDFEAALTSAPTPNPSSTSSTPRRPAISTSISTPPQSQSSSSSPRPSININNADSPTASALADSAIANLRASFRKGRASPSPSPAPSPSPTPESSTSRTQSIDRNKVVEPEAVAVPIVVVEKVIEKEEEVKEVKEDTESIVIDEPSIEIATKVVQPIAEEAKVVEILKESIAVDKDAVVVLEEKKEEEVKEPISTIIDSIATEESSTGVEVEVEAFLTSAQKKKNKKKNKKNGSVSVAEATPEESTTRSNSPIPDEEVKVEIPVVDKEVVKIQSTAPVIELPSPLTTSEVVQPINISTPTTSHSISAKVLPSSDIETALPSLPTSNSSTLIDSSTRKESSESPPSLTAQSPSSPSLTDSKIAADDVAGSTELPQAYQKLQALKSALDKIVSEVTTLSGVSDVEAFASELRNMKGKSEMSMKEIGRLSSEITGQKAIAEGLLLSHQVEIASQNDKITTLTLQLSEKDASLKSLNSSVSQSDTKTKSMEEAQIKLLEDYEKLKIVAKEEEEKRVKALSLLRALRQKLVKSEKDREEVEKERDLMRSAEGTIQDVIKSDRNRFDQEVTSLRAAQESQLSKMRVAFEKETNSIRSQFERESAARKGQYELDAITLKAAHVKELTLRDSRINQLEGKIKEMTTSRDGLFDQLQLKTAEVESSTSHQESLASQTTELRYELKEARDRASALKVEVEELRRARRDATRDDTNTRKLLGEAEARHESKLKELAVRAKQLEKDRQETEAEMGSNLQERMREVERMRQEIIQKDIDYAEATRTRVDRDTKIEEAETLKRDLVAKLSATEAMLEHSKGETMRLIQAEAAVREELKDRMDRSSELESRLEETQTKESTLRSNNKILRDELRKLQSGVLLSEKQRNPGVGYFASPSYSLTQSSLTSIPSSPTLSEQGSTSFRRESVSGEMNPMESSGEEALNFEYIRNVILQFLERPEMRTHLVSVLGVILHFTPAESRRLTFGSKQS